MRKALLAFLALALISGLAAAGTKEFYKGSFTLTPQVGINRWTIPFGLSAEYGLTPNISLGGSFMAWVWGNEWANESVIGLAAEGLYHFTGLRARGLDLFAGLALGYAIYSYNLKGLGDGWGDAGSSGLDLGFVAGGRYFFSPSLAVCLRFVSSFIGSWSGFGGQLGLTIRLK
jgi:hypothetical protein